MMGYNLAEERSYQTYYANSTFLPFLLMTLASQKHTPKITKTFNSEYDYVVVGAGAAGSVVASRLSENECVRVLLLEAGKSPPLLTDLPAVANQYIGSDLDWGFKTTPQKHMASLMKNRQISLPAGKAVGGSTIINDILYVRGNKADYDGWAKQGATGWSYKDVLPFFKEMEDNRNVESVDSGYHGVGGPVTVEEQWFDSKLRTALREAVDEKGYHFVDPNGATQIGFYNQLATLRNQQRCSSAKAYLVPRESKRNLHILANAFATKIITKKDKSGNIEAREVLFDYKGKHYRVTANKEIILSAGTIGTPKLLMLSGIGPKENLEALGIPVVRNLPVGRNLQDHVGSLVMHEYHGVTLQEQLQDPKYINEYIVRRTGPLTEIAGIQYIATMAINKMDTAPDYYLAFVDSSSTDFSGAHNTYRHVYEPYNEKPLCICAVSVLTPKSIGSLNITSKDPHEKPAIDPNYLAHDSDVTKLIEGMKTCYAISNTTALKRIGMRPFTIKVPGCEIYANDQDKYFRCTIKSMSFSNYHYVGTAKMGDPGDPSTVVDPELRVKGFKRLRVIDASIMPRIPRGNTMIPTMMIAEKGSHMIKKCIQCSKT